MSFLNGKRCGGKIGGEDKGSKCDVDEGCEISDCPIMISEFSYKKSIRVSDRILPLKTVSF